MFHLKFDEVNKIWNSCDVPPALNTNISIGHILLRSLKLNGPKIAQVSIIPNINSYIIQCCGKFNILFYADK